ncbi:MAG: hypothetical protein HQL36_07430, partial [Alphaproteobacteria bacterium]|nr:hypothetical protein [Alphaproteobacteria bacterium]
MTISSMTGFARSEGGAEACTWGWEAKSVNGKGLDVRVRFPRGFDFLDAPVRDLVQKRFKRGNISINLDLTWTRPLGQVRVNEDVLAQVLDAIAAGEARLPAVHAPSADGILALPG